MLAHAVTVAAKKAKVAHWHPYQLRHNYATKVRKYHGLEAAGAVLGHTRMSATEIYAERDEGQSEPSSAVGYAIVVGETGGVLRLDYQMTRSREKLDYAVELATTTCHLGGRRWWFICPLTRNGMTCTRRVRKLYLCGSYFGCRYCHDLTYTSRQESDGRVYAALRRGPHHDFGDIRGMSVSQLGFALKVLTAEQKRLDRLGKRLSQFTARRTKGQ